VPDDSGDRIYNYAMGLAEARVKHVDAVEELVALAGNRPEPLREALERTKEEVAATAERPSEGTDDTGPPEAPALLASRLLAEALESLADPP
jgi:hypothetical protein